MRRLGHAIRRFKALSGAWSWLRQSDTTTGFVALVVALALVSFALDAGRGAVGDQSWIGLGVLLALTVLSEHFAVDVLHRKTSVTVTLLLATGFLYGSWGTLAAVLTYALWVKIRNNTKLQRMLFNFGMGLLAAEAGQLVLRVALWRFGPRLSAEWLIAAATGSGLAYYVVNHLLIALVRGISERRDPRQIWLSDYKWLWPHYLVLGALAGAVSLSYPSLGPVGLVAIMSPVAMMHLAIKQYQEHTAIYVGELKKVNSQLSDSYESTLLALTRALDTRDEETEEHSQRVRRYSELISRRLRLPAEELEHLSRGALLHDIGKIGVPDAILRKPGRLTPEETQIMRRHPVIGHGMIAHIPFLSRAAEIVLHHHEAFDGSGYPSGLAGEDIPLGARIFAIADTLDAMTSDRPYRKALSYEVALAEIQRCRGKQFDPRIVDVLAAIPLLELVAIARRQAEPAMASRILGRQDAARPLAA